MGDAVLLAAVRHRTKVHVLLLVGDAVQYHECSAHWFVEGEEITWPPPIKQRQQLTASAVSAMPDKAVGCDGVKIERR